MLGTCEPDLFAIGDNHPELEEYIVKQISELLTNYGEITTLWFDMGLVTQEQSKRFREVVKAFSHNAL